METVPELGAWGPGDRAVPRGHTQAASLSSEGIQMHLSVFVGCSPLGVRRQHPSF